MKSHLFLLSLLVTQETHRMCNQTDNIIKSPRCLYNSHLKEFLAHNDIEILGNIIASYHGDSQSTTIESWEEEIRILKEQLSTWADEDAYIIFEYNIPRLGKRIDAVLLLRGVIFCMEFKVGKKEAFQADVEQVLDYALDLKNFHKFSEDKVIAPILVATNYANRSTSIQMSVYDDMVINPLVTGKTGISVLIQNVLNKFPNETPVHNDWIISPYAPTPTIVEAAKTLYESHSVENITRHEADKVSTDATIKYILDVIQNSKKNGEKSICFVTGVPGAGKTLVGLDVAIKQTYQGRDEPIKDESAVYLSGNGPLVAVLTEALAQDNYKKCRDKGEKKKITDSRREVGKSIQMIHRYRDNMLAKIKNPVESGVLEIDPEKAVKMENAGFGEVEHVALGKQAVAEVEMAGAHRHTEHESAVGNHDGLEVELLGDDVLVLAVDHEVKALIIGIEELQGKSLLIGVFLEDSRGNTGTTVREGELHQLVLKRKGLLFALCGLVKCRCGVLQKGLVVAGLGH